jgi:hypothetical protein
MLISDRMDHNKRIIQFHRGNSSEDTDSAKRSAPIYQSLLFAKKKKGQ